MAILFWLAPFFTLSFQAWADSKAAFWGYQIVKFLGMVGYIFIITYFGLVDQTWSAWLSHVGWVLAALWIADMIITSSIMEEELHIVTLGKTITGVIALLAYAYIVFIYPINIADDKFKVVQSKEVSSMIHQTDENNIVSVPKTYARYKAEKLEYKNYSYYDLGSYSIQEIDGKLFYVTPVEFSGYSTWKRSGKVVPGYIKVDAMDENAPVEFVEAEMKYTPSAYFGDNLLRKVRSEYPELLFLETNFEPDDNGKPYYTISYGHYEKFRSVPKVDGVVVVDPSNGQMKKYVIDKAPKFIDKIVPAGDIATSYNDWFGKYGNGWLNSWWGKQDIKLPSDGGMNAEVSPVFDSEGKMSWFTDFTTLNANASSMVGYSMINARTGDFTYYKGKKANGLANGSSAVKAVNKTYTKDKWEGVQPMLYNIYGEMTWFVPVVDGDGLLRSYALVNATDTKVIGTGTTKQNAFREYKKVIVSKLNAENVKLGTDLDTKKVKGIVLSKEVVAKEEDVLIYLRLDTDKTKIYQVSMNKVPFAVVLEKGQTVQAEYIDTGETIVDIETLEEVIN